MAVRWQTARVPAWMQSARARALAILILLAAGGAVGYVTLVPDSSSLASGSACTTVGRVHELAVSLATGDKVPVALDYSEAARAVREVAVEAPDSVAPDVHSVADAYGLLATFFRGFDPDDESSYSVVEQSTADIERQLAQAERADARIAEWLEARC